MSTEAISQAPRALAPTEPSANGPVSPLAFGALVSNHLERDGQLPPFLRDLVARSVVRHIDDDFVAEDPLTGFRSASRVGVHIPSPAIPVLLDVEATIGDIQLLGLGVYLKRLMGYFGEIMLCLTGTHEQQEIVGRWRQLGLTGTVLVTDCGGASPEYWLSRLRVIGPSSRASVDKAWGVDSAGCDYAVVLVARSGSGQPTALVLEPASYAALHHRPTGMALLGDAVQLGACSGEIPVARDMVLLEGGLIGIRQYFTTTRPLFVRACLAHLQWLSANGRLRLVGDHARAAVLLCNSALEMAGAENFTRQAADAANALKFATNALMLDLVETGHVRDARDGRDLLALSRLEGTSEQCFREIYSRARGTHRR